MAPAFMHLPLRLFAGSVASLYYTTGAVVGVWTGLHHAIMDHTVLGQLVGSPRMGKASERSSPRQANQNLLWQLAVLPMQLTFWVAATICAVLLGGSASCNVKKRQAVRTGQKPDERGDQPPAGVSSPRRLPISSEVFSPPAATDSEQGGVEPELAFKLPSPPTNPVDPLLLAPRGGPRPTAEPQQLQTTPAADPNEGEQEVPFVEEEDEEEVVFVDAEPAPEAERFVDAEPSEPVGQLNGAGANEEAGAAATAPGAALPGANGGDASGGGTSAPLRSTQVNGGVPAGGAAAVVNGVASGPAAVDLASTGGGGGMAPGGAGAAAPADAGGEGVQAQELADRLQCLPMMGGQAARMGSPTPAPNMSFVPIRVGDEERGDGQGMFGPPGGWALDSKSPLMFSQGDVRAENDQSTPPGTPWGLLAPSHPLDSFSVENSRTSNISNISTAGRLVLPTPSPMAPMPAIEDAPEGPGQVASFRIDLRNGSLTSSQDEYAPSQEPPAPVEGSFGMLPNITSGQMLESPDAPPGSVIFGTRATDVGNLGEAGDAVAEAAEEGEGRQEQRRA